MLSHLIIGVVAVVVVAVAAILVYRNNQRNFESRIAALEAAGKEAAGAVSGKPAPTDLHAPSSDTPSK